jgi:UDP-N-acetylglucosamine 2-epimerase
VVFHPTTTEYGGEQRQMQILLSALDSLRMPTLFLWPNIDAGSDHISKVIRTYRAQAQTQWMRTITNLTPENYLKVLATAACAVGNSSSFVRDAGYFGTPVVLVGNRQNGRETDEHVTRVPLEMDTIVATIKKQLAHGRFAPSTLYGDGRVAERIAAALENLTPYLQKQLAFTLAE